MSKSTRLDSKENESEHLPIYQHKAKLIQAVKDSTFLVVTGETGSGKTTQLPKYLHQAGKLSFCCPAPFNMKLTVMLNTNCIDQNYTETSVYALTYLYTISCDFVG